MLINLSEEIVPTSNESAFVLVSDELDLILGPALLDTSNEFVKDELTTSFTEDL